MSSTPAPVGDYADAKTPAAAPASQSGVCIWDAFGGFACPSKSPIGHTSMPSAAIFEGFFSSGQTPQMHTQTQTSQYKKPAGPAPAVPEGFCGCGAGGSDIIPTTP